MNDRPQARTDGVISELVGDDLVVYDEVSRTAHSLSAAAASVWELCDGKRSSQEIAQELSLEPAMAARAVAELSECGLLDDSPSAAASVGISRREAAKKFARVGGAALVAPLIYSMAIGPATAAASPQPNCTSTGTTNSSQCDATPGNFGNSAQNGGSTSGCCSSGVCYQTKTGSVYLCETSTAACKKFGAAGCATTPCCAGTCSGSPAKCTQ